MIYVLLACPPITLLGIKDKDKDKDKDTLFQVNITHSYKKHVNTMMICIQ